MDNAVYYGEAMRVQKAQRARKVELVRLTVPYLVIGTAVALSLFVYLWTRVSVTTLNYEIADLKSQERVLARENRELKIELDTKTSPTVLDRVGRERYGLSVPDDSSIIVVR